MTAPAHRRQVGVHPRSRSAGLTRPVLTLAASLGRRCRGRTLVCQDYGEAFAAAMRPEHEEIECVARDPASWPQDESVRTLVLAGVLEALGEPERHALLNAAWQRVSSGGGGRLVVCVANPDAGETEWRRPSWDRRRLEKVLAPLGRTRLAADQPYRWLTVWVEKRWPEAERVNRTNRRRGHVTARLCRGRVIELGCGRGHLSGMIAARGHEVVGVDHNQSKIALARHTYPGVEFHAADIAELCFPEGSFDTVVLAEVLEHVDEPAGARFLAVAWGLVRRGGRLIVSVPNEDCIPHRNHVRVFDRRGLRALLRPLGRPRLVTDQPYQWLLMYVDKK